MQLVAEVRLEISSYTDGVARGWKRYDEEKVGLTLRCGRAGRP